MHACLFVCLSVCCAEAGSLHALHPSRRGSPLPHSKAEAESGSGGSPDSRGMSRSSSGDASSVGMGDSGAQPSSQQPLRVDHRGKAADGVVGAADQWVIPKPDGKPQVQRVCVCVCACVCVCVCA